MKLWELLHSVPLTGETPELDMEINSISYDTRTLEPGALFAALPGARDDGARYIREALDRGAAAVLCRERPEEDGPWLVTPDPRRALALLSANWFGRPAEGLTLVGVTGTNGKTTTAFLIKDMLETVLRTRVGLIGTVQNMVGDEVLPAGRTTPESYELQGLLRRMADGGCTHVVMEVSSHALVQHRVEGLEFSVGVFTNLTQDHLDYHGSMEAYRQAKGLLFRQCRKAVLNLDDPAGRWYGERVECPAFTYSENKDAACLTAKNIRLFPGHVEFEAVSREDIQRIHLPIPGGFTIYNALAAISCGLCLGLTLADIAASLRSAKGVRGRVEVVPVPTAYTVLIDYAHTPNALENVLLTAGWEDLQNGLHNHLVVFLFALVFGAIGFVDDLQKLRHHANEGLTAPQKFLLQLAAAIAFTVLLRRDGYLTPDLYIPFLNIEIVGIPWIVYMVFAAFVMVGTVNAVNLTDGVDGLATGVTIPVMLFYVAVSAWYGRSDLITAAAAMAGGLSAFLIYNFHPAKVFMGDTGSLFLGGAVCGMAFALDLPMVIPVVGLIYVVEVLSDIIQVVYFKKTGGKRFFRMAPLHHHLEMGGWSENKLFCVFSGLTLLLCVLAFWGVMYRYPM